MSDQKPPYSKQPGYVSLLDPYDARARSEVTPESGLTLRQAMLFCETLDLADEFLDLEYEFDGDPPMKIGLDGWPTDPSIIGAFETGQRKLRIALGTLTMHLMDKLRVGELIAQGFASNQGINEAAQRTHTSRWRLLEPDIEKSSARSDNLIITGILVFKSSKPKKQDKSELYRKYSEADVRHWYQKRITNCVEAGTIPSREEDAASARQHFEGGVSRDLLRQLRREYAPAEWSRRSRRKNGES